MIDINTVTFHDLLPPVFQPSAANLGTFPSFNFSCIIRHRAHIRSLTSLFKLKNPCRERVKPITKMRSLLPAGIAIASLVSGAAGQACADGRAQEINGNWYCQAVQAITYTNFGSVGSYNKVNLMDQQSGTCGSSPYGYRGAMAPMDEEVSCAPRTYLKLFC